MSSLLGELVPCGGGDSIPLLKPLLVVGRASTCDVVLNFPTVSSRHCELEFKDGQWSVRDLGSRNGVRVNGVPCATRQLMPNDTVAIAQFRFSVAYSGKPSSGASDPLDDWIERSMAEDVTWRQQQEQAAGGRRSTSVSASSSLGELLPCGGGEPIALLKPSLIVGRHGKCDIIVDFPTVSSRHCQLEFKKGYWFVHDLASRNGIRVDGEPCESKCLVPNSVLSLAKHRYLVAYTPQADELPPEAEENTFGRSLLEKAGLVARKEAEDPVRLPPRRGADPDAARARWSLDEDV